MFQDSIRRRLMMALCMGFACATACANRKACGDDDPLRAFESALMRAIARAEPSVVSLARVRRPRRDERPPAVIPRSSAAPTESGFIPTDFGSGVIIGGGEGEQERYVLTAAHVVFGQRSFTGALPAEEIADWTIYVRLASRHVLAAELMAADQRSDFAVLRLPLREAGIPLDAAPAIELSGEDRYDKGRVVVALGNPYAIARDGAASASFGIISNVSRKPWPPRGVLVDPTEADLTIHHYGTLLHVDTRLNLGASGGALVDLEGRLIGMTTSLAALEGYEKSVGYAVPIDASAREIIESLRQGYEVEYGFLGVLPGEADWEALEPFRKLTTQASAARVRRVAAGSPAERAGLRSGDFIVAVGGNPVYTDIDLVREVGWLGPDTTAALSVLRAGADEILQIQCRLGKWPVYDDSLLVATRERHPAWRGLHIDYATARRRYLPANPLGSYPQGVVIRRVDAGSPGEAAELVEGMFIVAAAGRRVESPAEFARAVADRHGDVAVELSDGTMVVVSEMAR